VGAEWRLGPAGAALHYTKPCSCTGREEPCRDRITMGSWKLEETLDNDQDKFMFLIGNIIS